MESAAGFDQCGVKFSDAHGTQHRCSLSAGHRGSHWCAEHKVRASHQTYAFDSDAIDDIGKEPNE